MSGPLNFYATKHPFSNFHPSPLVWNGASGGTVEHLYQAMKFVRTNPQHAQKILSASTPKEAKQLGSLKGIPLDPDWEKVLFTDTYLGEVRYKDYIMYQILLVKFSQLHFRQKLLETGNRLLVEDSPWDMYWGGRNGGKNMLGKILMRIRLEIQTQNANPVQDTITI